MVRYDEALAGQPPRIPAGADPLAPELGPRWQQLEACLRGLRHAFPRVPPEYPGRPANAFGRFMIGRELGRGGFGVVFLAEDTLLKRPVALKLPRPETVADPSLRDRFLREARAAAGLQHPGIVPVYEAGEVGPVCYIAAAYCPGIDLARWLRANPGPVEPKLAASLSAALAEAVQHAHAHGILHRDLKPSNVLLESEPGPNGPRLVPKLTDFGLARLLEADGEQTSSGVVLGTPLYMAPEQAEGRGDRVSAATDVYALGVILYELLTGLPPSRGTSLLQTLEQVRSAWPVPVRRLRAGVPRDLETVCLKCLHKEPHRRYASAAELAADLRRFLGGEPVRARPVGSAEIAWFWARRNPALATLAASVLGLLVLTAVISAAAAVRLARSAEVARQAERNAMEKLFRSSLAQARALRLGGYAGQRYQSLAALRQAAESARAIGLGPDDLLEARNEAVACLSLTDFRVDREWEGHPDGSNGIAFDSRFDRYARSDRDGTISVRRVAGDVELFRFTAGPPVESSGRIEFQFGAGDRFLAVRGSYGRGRALSVWELGPKGASLRLQLDAAEGQCDFTPDGRYLVTGLPGGVTGVFDLADGKLHRRFASGPPPFQYAVDPSGRRVAVSSERAPGMRVLDLGTGAVVREFRHEPNAVDMYCHGVAWDPAGRLLAVGGCDHRVYLWDAETGARIRTLDRHFWEINAVVFNRSGERLVSSAFDRTNRLWDVNTGRELFKVQARFVNFAGDDRLALMPDGKHVQVGTTTPGPVCRVFYVGGGAANLSEFLCGGSILAAADRDVRLWDVETGRELGKLPSNRPTFLRADQLGRLITYDADAVRRWRVRRGVDGTVAADAPEVLWKPDMPLADDLFAWLGPAGNTLVLSEGQRRVRLVALDSPEQSATIDPDFPGARFVTGSPDGRWVAAGVVEGTGGLRVYDARSHRIVNEWRAGIVNPLFSPDGRWLAVSTGTLAPSGAACSLWRVGTWEPVHSWPVDRTSSPSQMAFSPDGRILAVQCDMTAVRLFDTSTFAELATLRHPDSFLLWMLVFSPDGHTLASTTGEGVAHLWDLRKLRESLGEIGLDWKTAEGSGEQ
jgi:WD40 repeat protein/tRNA A-37 threonylcarbamoyl transferase component Bud32